MPYLPKERQYRNFAASNFAPVTRADDGEAQEPSYIVQGHFTVFDNEYPVFSDFYESIDRHALDETDMSDTIFQFNHSGLVLSRVRNDSLQVGVDADGGWVRADLSGCQKGRNLYEAISNGLIDRMSFGFTIADGGFEYEVDDDGIIHSRITKIDRLYDVSAVDLPCNPDTDISARSYVDAAIEARRKVEEAERAEAERVEREEQERVEREARAVSLRKRRAKALAMQSIS